MVWRSATSKLQLRSVELGAGEDKIELCEIQHESDQQFQDALRMKASPKPSSNSDK
jgi:hypothetical protein